MTKSEHADLTEAVKLVTGKIKRYQDGALGEQNTKASLIDPILEALGWDVRDPDEVHREFKPTTRDSPVDYALTILRKPRLFVEAKGLGETLSDRKWIAQVLGYATVAGVVWCVLSDGDEYRLYNATAPLDAEEKLFCSIRLSTSTVEDVVNTLVLISRSNMEENILDVRWVAHYVDRRVKNALQEMFGTTDTSLVRLIRNREPMLTPKDIVESLRRLAIRIESATSQPHSPSPKRKPIERDSPPPSNFRAKKRVAEKPVGKKAFFGITLLEIIKAGQLTTPLKLFKKYKGRLLEAVVLEDGTVECCGERFQSCSTAAEKALLEASGRALKANGWDFWQFSEGRGKKAPLSVIRDRYIANKS